MSRVRHDDEPMSPRLQRRYEDHLAYSDTGERRRSTDHPETRRRSSQWSRWPAWIQIALAVLGLFAAGLLAYADLDKRQALMDQRFDELMRRFEQHVNMAQP